MDASIEIVLQWGCLGLLLGKTVSFSCTGLVGEKLSGLEDFTLHTTPDQTVSLHDFRGQPVILAFYPADWSPVCSDEMALFNEVLPEFHRYHAELMGLSVDGVWCHLAFAKDRKLRFPLLSDFEPKGEVARAYRAYRKQDGTTERALFVIDAEGKIRWSHISPPGINPGADGVLEALESMTPSAATSSAT